VPPLVREHQHSPQHSRGSPTALRAHSQKRCAARLMPQQVRERQRPRQPPASHRWQAALHRRRRARRYADQVQGWQCRAGRGHEGEDRIRGDDCGTGELGD